MSYCGLSSLVYPPLQPGHIRLIKVLQQPHQRPYLSCELQNVDMEHAPQFTALSYTWGGQIPNRIVCINDAWLKITPNLYAFFLQVQTLGDEGIEKGIEWVWVDAVCINQQDDVEKSVQVGIMRQIYERAQEVVVWLGEATYALERFFKDLEKRREVEDQNQNEQRSTLYEPKTQELSNLQLPKELVEHPYWRRVWILQEITSSPAKGVSLWYGHASCSFATFLQAALAVLGGRRNTQVNHKRGPFEVLEHLRGKRRQSSVTIMDIFKIKGQCDASDPKDKLLALLQLTPDALGFSPNYSMTLQQIYTDFARHLIKCYRNLNLLEYAPTRRTVQATAASLSSWVPDWTLDDFHPTSPQSKLTGFYCLIPFRNRLSDQRLRLPSDCRIQGAEHGNSALRVAAIILAVVDKNVEDMIYLPRYCEAFPDEASLWTTALSLAALDTLSSAEFSRLLAKGFHLPHYLKINSGNLHLQSGDVLCVLPGARWPAFIRPAFIRPAKASHGMQRKLIFEFLSHGRIPSSRHPDAIFADQLYDIMIDDLLLDVEATEGLRPYLLQRTRERLQEKDAASEVAEGGERGESEDSDNLRREGACYRHERFQRQNEASFNRERIHADTDLSKYAVRIQLI